MHALFSGDEVGNATRERTVLLKVDCDAKAFDLIGSWRHGREQGAPFHHFSNWQRGNGCHCLGNWIMASWTITCVRCVGGTHC